MRNHKDQLKKALLYFLAGCGIIMVLLRLYTIFTICISPAASFEPQLPREDIIRITGSNLSNILMSYELTSDKAAAFIEATVGLLSEVVQIVILILAIRVFLQHSIHRPFQWNMINWMQGFAVLYCILPVLQGLFTLVVIGTHPKDMYPTLIYFQIFEIGMQALPGLAIIGIAKVFRYGYALQNEVDQII